MKPEDKAAIKAAGTTVLVAGVFATMIANPVAWAAVGLGAYRMGKLARDHTKDQQRNK
jgi:multisubunit Na+/H+ antiporter MnhG subunit